MQPWVQRCSDSIILKLYLKVRTMSSKFLFLYQDYWKCPVLFKGKIWIRLFRINKDVLVDYISFRIASGSLKMALQSSTPNAHK
jgi:hypothetical protein